MAKAQEMVTVIRRGTRSDKRRTSYGLAYLTVSDDISLGYGEVEGTGEGVDRSATHRLGVKTVLDRCDDILILIGSVVDEGIGHT